MITSTGRSTKKNKKKKKTHRQESQIQSVFVEPCPLTPSSVTPGGELQIQKHSVWMNEIWAAMTPNERLSAILPYRDESGRCVLSRAARTGDQTFVKQLLQTPGVMYMARDIYGNTALHHAALSKHEEVLLLLLTCKQIDSTMLNQNGSTAYEITVALTPEFFTAYTVLICYARLTIDRAIEKSIPLKMKMFQDIRQDERNLEQLLSYIVTLIRAAWINGDFYREPFPEEVFSDHFIRELIMRHYKRFFHLQKT